MREPNAQLARIASNVRGVLWPPISAGPAGTLAALVRSLDETQWLDPDEIEAAQRAQLGVLVPHATERSPAFRDRLGAAGLAPADLLRPQGLAALPPLTRRALQAAGPSLFCGDLPERHEPVEETSTSGSTGEPVVVRRTAVNRIMWSALTVRDYLWRGLDFHWRISVSRPTITSYAERPSWGAPVSRLFASGPCQLLPTDLPIEDLAQRLTAFSPHVLVVYPTVLRALIAHLAERGMRLPELRLVHTIAETLSPSLRERAEATLQARVWDTYSSQEVGNIATQCPETDSFHVVAEAVLVEVLDDAGRPCRIGETGRVVITDLHNLATPLVRYDIGDYAQVGGPCPCGRGLPVLRRVLGRERNLVVLPDGSRHWPQVGFHRFGEIAPIRQYQVIQRERDLVEVRMVAGGTVSAEQEAALTTVIQQALGHPFPIHFTWYEDRLPVEPGGKFEEFRCEVAGS